MAARAPLLVAAAVLAVAAAGSLAVWLVGWGAARAATAAAGAAPDRAVAAAPPARLHLSLGDSLARGVQPAPDGRPRPTAEGYGPIVARSRKLRLVELGCPGETAVSMATGSGPCRYRTRSQLRAAEAFLRRHRGRVRLVTVSIGGNDVLRCGSVSGVDEACALRRALDASDRVASVARRLRRAAGGARVVGLTYANPFLGLYVRGEEGRRDALASVRSAAAFNDGLRAVYRRAGVRTADVDGAFSSSALSRFEPLAGLGPVPVAVARACELSWACAAPPRGPDVHPNAAGYGVIARAVLRAARRR